MSDITITYDGATLSAKVPPTKISVPLRAELGSQSNGGISPEDPGAALNLVGWRPIAVEEGDCSQPRLFTGYVFDRNIGRSLDQAQFVGPDARIHDTTITDLNAVFQMRIISGTDAKRPSETMDARMAWILGSDYLAGTPGTLIEDTGKVLTGLTRPMDEADYTGRYPGDVLTDLANRSQDAFNWFAFWDPAPSSGSPRPGLFFDYVGVGTSDSTISISNVLADVNDSTCFAPITESRLERTPETVYSDVIVTYKGGGSVVRHLDTTAATYIKRGTSIDRPYTGQASTAASQGDDYLKAHSKETDHITTTIHVPSSAVGLVQAGQRMQVRFSHLTGYETTTWMQIVASDPRAVDDLAQWYDVDLELVVPKPASTCPALGPYLASNPLLLDALGGHITSVLGPPYFAPPFHPAPAPSMGYQYNGPATPPTVTPAWISGVDYTGTPLGLYGTPDSSIAFGMGANVCNGPQTIQAGWTFDTGTAVSICLFVFGGEGSILQSYGTGTIALDASNNGTSWTSITTPSDIAGNLIAGTSGDTIAAIPTASSTAFRYWRVTFKWSDPSGGLHYFPGYDFTFVALYATSDYTPTTGAVIPTVNSTITNSAPTVTNDSANGYATGSTWIDTSTGSEYVLVDDTTGAAVWVSTTAVSVFSFSTTDGVTTVNPTIELTFVGATLTDLGGGDAEITLPGGGSLEVKEVDGTPDVTGVTQIIVPNGSLTDNTGGSVSVAFSGGSGALVLLEQHTASSSATLDFTSCITSTYDEYVFELLGVLPVSNAVSFGCRVSTDGGSTWDSTSGHYLVRNVTAGGGIGMDTPGTDAIWCSYSGDNISNAGRGGVSGSLRYVVPVTGSTYPAFIGHLHYWDGTYITTVLVSGEYQTGGAAIDALRFAFSSGNIASGTIRVYGIAK